MWGVFPEVCRREKTREGWYGDETGKRVRDLSVPKCGQTSKMRNSAVIKKIKKAALKTVVLVSSPLAALQATV